MHSTTCGLPQEQFLHFVHIILNKILIPLVWHCLFVNIYIYIFFFHALYVMLKFVFSYGKTLARILILNFKKNLFTILFQVLQYFSRQRHSKKYVLVHCTHGHNRTGFMIIHFLMRSQPVSVSEVRIVSLPPQVLLLAE